MCKSKSGGIKALTAALLVTAAAAGVYVLIKVCEKRKLRAGEREPEQHYEEYEPSDDGDIQPETDDTAEAPHDEPEPPADGEAAEDGKVNINLADLKALTSVNGIGEHTAKSIIALRDKKGGLSDISELLEIEGIGKGKLAKLSENLFV